MVHPERIYSVFVSSTTEDLSRYRARARDILLTYDLRPLEMEYFPAESGAKLDTVHQYLDAADGVVLIAGARYGSLVGEISFVEWEFSQALARGIPVVCLIMSKQERYRISLPDQERDKQERFIERLRDHSKVAEFNGADFDLALAGALRLLPRQFRRGAGLVRASAYDDVVGTTSAQLKNLRAHRSILRLLSSIGLVRQLIRYERKGDDHFMKVSNERAILDRLLELLYADLANRPITTNIIESLVRRLIERLHGFTGSYGFVPDSVGELEACIDELFGDTLSVLKATSIHSNHEALAAYKGYWQDLELGPFFKRKNEHFLARGNGGKVLRVFACDSIAGSVAEAWFTETVIKQVTQGADVKVVQIDVGQVSGYEDFGIYEHGAKSQAGKYLLLAPRDRNLRQRSLTTSVTADEATVAAYSRKFEALWQQSAEPLGIIRDSVLDDAAHRPLTSHGQGTITDLFGRCIILRRMERLDTGERLLAPSMRFVRKYQPAYVEALSSHLRLRFPGIRHLLYVGDTHKNDGAAIRNLQKLGWDVTGFICEPDLGIGQLWFNNVIYTNRWTDLVGLADRAKPKVGPDMLAIFDIDQTLWAPKGVHEGPITHSRTRAMSRLIDNYVSDPNGHVARRAKARLELLYREISASRYLPLTLDNEDFKAAICVFLSLNVMFDRHRLEKGGREEGAAFFEEIGHLEATQYVELMRTAYLPSFLEHQDAGEASITQFLMETLSAAQTYQYTLYGETNGVLVTKVGEHLREVFRETVGVAPVQYPLFRAMELEEALSRIGDGDSLEDQLVLNKPAWDLAMWLKQKGAGLLALSDRPDESTISAHGDSLLSASMTIYGRDISADLARLPA